MSTPQTTSKMAAEISFVHEKPPKIFWKKPTVEAVPSSSAAPTALAPRTAPLDLNQLMQEPQRMARVAHDLSLLSQALQGLSEDLWQQGEEGRK